MEEDGEGEAKLISKRKRKLTSQIWIYFEKIDDKQAKCKVCSVIRIRGKRSNGNLYRHLQLDHNDLYMELYPDVKQAILTSEEIINLVSFMIVKDSLPLNVVNNEGFKNLMDKLCPEIDIPTRFMVSELIQKKFSSYIQLERDLINDQIEFMSLKSDLWSDLNQRSYLSLTMHYIWEGKLKSMILAVEQMMDNHTCGNIQSLIEKILEDFHIEKTKIVGIVTDNARNIIKATENTFVSEKKLTCFGHNLNLMVNDSLCGPLKSTIEKAKEIVSFFKHSNLANDSLCLVQQQCNVTPLKLVQECPT